VDSVVLGHTPGVTASPRTGKLAIYRLLGNDLPPRHQVGQTLENTRFILDREPTLRRAERRWVLNRIVDAQEEGQLLELLQARGERFLRIPVDFDEYRRRDATRHALPRREANRARRHEKVLCLVDLNGARNLALEDGRRDADWILPLDGNCFFTLDGWEALLARLDAAPQLDRHLIIPMYRLRRNEEATGFRPDPRAEQEPQIGFGRAAHEVYDPQFRYGLDSKIELLKRLRVKMEPSSCGLRLSPDAPRDGYVLRLASGNGEADHASRRRRHLRDRAIDLLLARADRLALPTRAPRLGGWLARAAALLRRSGP